MGRTWIAQAAGRACVLGIALVFVAGLVSITASQARTQRDSVYSDAQAKRGESLYGPACGACHGDDLLGGGFAPELTGIAFSRKWDGFTLNDLVERIRTTMPQGNPETLSRQQVTDIVAFILHKNSEPAGETELSAQADVLKQIAFTAPK